MTKTFYYVNNIFFYRASVESNSWKWEVGGCAVWTFKKGEGGSLPGKVLRGEEGAKTMICPFVAELPEPANEKKGWPWTQGSEKLPEKMLNENPWPKITVVTPSYNQGQFLEETIRSVLLQGYPDLEYIIIDGGSTDNSIEIIKKYETWLYYWESQPDRGQCHAINKGWKKAESGVWAWLNSDDIYMTGTFGKAASALKESDDINLVYATANYIDEESRIVGQKYKARPLPQGIERMKFWTGWPIPQPTIFFNSSILEKYGPLDERYHYSLDYEWLIRVSRKQTFMFINDIWAGYRRHEESKGGDWEAKKEYFFSECRRANRKNSSILENLRLTREEYKFNKEMKEKIKKRNESPWFQKYNALRPPKYAFGVPHADPRIHEEILKELTYKNFNVVDYKINAGDYKLYLEKARYHRFQGYQQGGESKSFPEKTLEHFLAAKFLELSKQDVYIDIATCGSPTPGIYRDIYGCKVYKQDIVYKKGVYGNTIGSDGSDVPLPNEFATKMALHSSFEHFEGDADIGFLIESDRLLRSGGKVCIVPFYLFNRYAIQIDPGGLKENDISFEKDAILYCARRWNSKHARFYDVPHLITRIKGNLGTLRLTVYNVLNAKEICPSCYLKFAAVLEKRI